MDINYNIVGVIKSQICSTIANSENVRKAIDFKVPEKTESVENASILKFPEKK